MEQRCRKRRRRSLPCPTTEAYPQRCVQELFAEGYASMLAIGMLLDEDEPFGTLMQRCALIEKEL